MRDDKLALPLNQNDQPGLQLLLRRQRRGRVPVFERSAGLGGQFLGGQAKLLGGLRQVGLDFAVRQGQHLIAQGLIARRQTIQPGQADQALQRAALDKQREEGIGHRQHRHEVPHLDGKIRVARYR